jgi:hypothetical protein
MATGTRSTYMPRREGNRAEIGATVQDSTMRFGAQESGILLPSYGGNEISVGLVDMQEQSTETWLTPGTKTLSSCKAHKRYQN